MLILNQVLFTVRSLSAKAVKYVNWIYVEG